MLFAFGIALSDKLLACYCSTQCFLEELRIGKSRDTVSKQKICSQVIKPVEVKNP